MNAQPTPNRPGRKLKALLFAAALTPFFCAVLAHAVGASPQKPVPGEQPAPLVFERYQVNLHEVPPLPILEATFRFTNHSGRTVTIKELKPSCGCLNPRLEKRVYQPGESGRFSVRVETAGEKPGPKEYTIDVICDAPRPRQVQLTFKFILPEKKVVITPRALIFYQLGGGATEREIVISDFRDNPLKITGVSSKSEFVSARVTQAGTTEFGHYEARLSVKVAGVVPPGKQETLLELKTDDPTYPLLRVPLWIHGLDKQRSPSATQKRAVDAQRL